MLEQEIYNRVIAQVEERLTSFEAFEILKNAKLAEPFGITNTQEKLVELVKREVSPQKLGAHHQYIAGEAEEALCAVCGSSEAENAPDCRWD